MICVSVAIITIGYLMFFRAMVNAPAPSLANNKNPFDRARPLSLTPPPRPAAAIAAAAVEKHHLEEEWEHEQELQHAEHPGLPIMSQHDRHHVYPTGVVIGFAVTVTGCGSDPITEGAAVLKHAIHLASMHGNLGGRYDYKMYAIYHPDGESCATPLQDLGYELLRRETPVAVKDIQGEYLRTRIEKNGCCGEKELVKLEAYTLIQHPIVVHLDLDTLVLRPLDSLFDWMLLEDADHDTEGIQIMWPDMPHPHKVNAYFTRDCKYPPHTQVWLSHCYNAYVVLYQITWFTQA